MDASNLSIVMAPTLMPVHIASTSRNDRQNCTKLQNSAKVIQVSFRVDLLVMASLYFVLCDSCLLKTVANSVGFHTVLLVDLCLFPPLH